MRELRLRASTAGRPSLVLVLPALVLNPGWSVPPLESRSRGVIVLARNAALESFEKGVAADNVSLSPSSVSPLWRALSRDELSSRENSDEMM